jgi:hypothetical protein
MIVSVQNKVAEKCRPLRKLQFHDDKRLAACKARVRLTATAVLAAAVSRLGLRTPPRSPGAQMLQLPIHISPLLRECMELFFHLPILFVAWP